MSEQEEGNAGAGVQFIGVLNTIYKKLTDAEKQFLMDLTSKAGAMRKHAQDAQDQLDETQQMLIQTQMFLAVLVKEHGVRSGDDSRAVLRLHRQAFEHVKGDLESWDEPDHFVLSYKESASKAAGEGDPVPGKSGQNTPAPAGAERTPN